MKIRFPLYARWAIGFALHVALFAAAGAALLSGRYREPVTRLVLRESRGRIEAAIRRFVSEIEALPPDEWDGAVQRFERQYDVRLALLTLRGEPLAGSIETLPEEIGTRLRLDPSAAASPTADSPPGSPAPALAPPISSDAGETGPVALGIERAGAPPRYWIWSRIRVQGPGRPLHAALAIETRGWFGGLLADPRPLVFGALALALISMLLWMPFVRGITRSVESLTRAGRRIAEGRFDTRVAVRRRDELGELARTMNEMAARLDALVGDQKRFLGGIAHELCAPLARLQLALGSLEQRAKPEIRPFVESALAQAKEVSDLVNELLSFSRAAYGRAAVQCRPVALEPLARAVAGREAAGRAVRIEMPPGLAARADAALLERALANLLRNAARYAGETPITVRGAVSAEGVTLSVEDEGPGVPPAALPRLFEPFFRVESSRAREAGGQGLGLTLVKAALESMGGAVYAELRQPHGLAVRLRLPAAEPDATGCLRET